MASTPLKFHIETFKPSNISIKLLQNDKFISPYFPFPKTTHYTQLSHSLHTHRFKSPSLSINSSLSSSSPPSSKEEAILQAKTCLSTTLQKPLNNPKLIGKLKKLKQPRFQVEIPINDDSPSSLSQLAFDLLNDLPLKRKGVNIKILILWPNQTLKAAAIDMFQPHSSSNIVEHADISAVINNKERSVFGSSELAVFLAPERSQLASIKATTDILYPKPVVTVNPRWGFQEENDYGDLNGFVGSFEVIYSFLGLEVKGILSKRKGVVFKCVRDGVVSGENWKVLVEEEEGGEMKAVSSFKNRPSIGEVETVLYNLTAINSPITKSAKFLKDLVSNVTGKK